MTRAIGRGTVPNEFVGFFDDAATFPPGLAPLDQAIKDHVARWANPLCGAVGPAVLSLKDLPAARRIASDIDRGGRPVEVSAVVPAGRLDEALDTVRRSTPDLNVVSLEVKTDPEDRGVCTTQILEAAAVEEYDVFVELAADQVADGALRLLGGTKLRLKYRTGGIEAHLFPTPGQLAGVIMEAISMDVPFKLTAGLHEAVRYTNPGTGFTHHGFLNIALATAAARDHKPTDTVVQILAETDPAPLVELAAGADRSWRASFQSFGTCSVAEPAESLEKLGLFPPGLA